MGTCVGYVFLVWIMSFAVSFICGELSPAWGGIISTFITTFFYLGYTAYAHQDSLVKKEISFSHFFDSFKKPIEVLSFTIIQYLYIALVVFILLW